MNRNSGQLASQTVSKWCLLDVNTCTFPTLPYCLSLKKSIYSFLQQYLSSSHYMYNTATDWGGYQILRHNSDPQFYSLEKSMPKTLKLQWGSIWLTAKMVIACRNYWKSLCKGNFTFGWKCQRLSWNVVGTPGRFVEGGDCRSCFRQGQITWRKARRAKWWI